MNDELAQRSQRRTVRQHMLLNGVFIALSMMAIGLVNMRFGEGWAQSIVIGLIVALILLVMLRADRATPAQVSRVRSSRWFALVVSGLMAVAVAALADQFVARHLAIAAAAVAAISVWAVVGWWVSRPGRYPN